MSLKYGLSIAAIALLASTLSASEELPKRAMKTNCQLVYNEKPAKVDKFKDMFKEGMFYGRLRSNSFYYEYKNESETKRKKNHFITGLGGSLVYRSASFNNFDFSTSLYFSKSYWDDENIPANTLKSGKDTTSRYNYSQTGSKSMSALGEAKISYSGISKTKLIVGRQIVETFYTKSNDTKMIPNVFDGAVVTTKIVPKTSIKFAYLTEQKLRDHTTSHSILAVGDGDEKWNENDDSAMHKGLTISALRDKGKPTDSPLIVLDIKNKSIKNLKFDTSFYVVPELISQAMTEINYTIKLGKISVTPAIRYIKQFDNGAGEVGGASYSKGLNATGYKDINSLDAQMIAARVVTKISNYKVNLGYTNIFDEADLITPWRGFPTAGYTRSMGRYNWKANTKSYRFELVRNGNKKGIYKDIFTQFSILYTDEDEAKGGKDEMFYYIGFVQNIPSLVNLQWRLRLGYADYKDSDDSEYNNLDSRFEINYLF